MDLKKLHKVYTLYSIPPWWIFIYKVSIKESTKYSVLVPMDKLETYVHNRREGRKDEKPEGVAPESMINHPPLPCPIYCPILASQQKFTYFGNENWSVTRWFHDKYKNATLVESC